MKPTPPRFLLLDYLRIILLFGFMIAHTCVWLISDGDNGISQEFSHLSGFFEKGIIFIAHLLGGSPGAVPFLMGLTIRYTLKEHWDDFPSLKVSKYLRRGLGIILLGFVMNALTWGWEDFFNWDIMPLYGASLIIITLMLRFLGKWALYSFATLVFLLTDPLRNWVYSVDENITKRAFIIIFGDLNNDSFWPMMPWFSFIVFGLMYLDLLLTYGKIKLASWTLPLSLIGMIIMYFLGYNPIFRVSASDFWGTDLYIQHFDKCLGGLFLIGFYFSFLIFIPFEKLKVSEAISKLSEQLTPLYLFHTIVMYHFFMTLKSFIHPSIAVIVISCLAQVVLFSFIFLKFDTKKYYRKLNLSLGEHDKEN